jgi:tetratricopeptide (TPR) repeat protein
VVSVALDLGIVTIQRAQTFTDPAKRTAELKEAEGIFLAIRGVAGETDAYRMWLGQVDYWLGKPEEGRKLLDELLSAKKRDPKFLIRVASVLREVGDNQSARSLVEEAFTSAKTPVDQHEAAHLRAVLYVDLDDEIVWLERCDQTSPQINANLHSVHGARAHREGRDQEAIGELNRALEAWSAMPRTDTTLNNGALVAQQLYAMSGDPEHLRIACSRLEEAHLLNPSNTILLNNLLTSRVSLAGADSVKDVLDAKAIRRALDVDEFDHCYQDHAGREALVARYRAMTAHQNLLADADRLMLMSPREATSYKLIAEDLVLSRDATALAAFATRTATADIDQAASWGVMQDFLAGKRDAQMATESSAVIKRLEQRVAELRSPGQEATLALALSLLVSKKMEAAAWGQPVDPEACLVSAEEAARLHPCHATTVQLVRQLDHRAAIRLAQSDPAFAGLVSGQQRLLRPSQLILYLASDGHWRAQLANDADLTRAAVLTLAELRALPEAADVWDWALLEAIGDPGAAALATQLRSDPIPMLQSGINMHLMPQIASVALNEALLLRLQGDPAKAKATLEAARKRGLPLAAEL